MGLEIGNSLSAISQQSTLSGRGTGRVAGAPPSPDEQNNQPVARQAGFGDNTLSPANAALDSIDQTITRARERDVVPSVEDLRQDFRERVERETPAEAERPEAAENENQQVRTPPERVRPEASPQVRAFENQRNVPPPQQSPTGEPTGQNASTDLTPSNTRLDVFA